LGSAEVVMFRVGGFTVSESPALTATDAASVTLTVKLEVPAVAGVPEIVPSADRFKPDGSDPLDIDHE
jgi:hypothetical protein